MSINYTTQTRLFQDFRSIPFSDYHYLISFYEKNHKDVRYLPFEEEMTILFYYTNALFETHNFNTHITLAERLLELSIVHNLTHVDEYDVYMTLLHQKTASHLYLGETEKATRLAKQLIGIDKNQRKHQLLLQQCFLINRPSWIRPTLTFSAIATLMGAFTMIIFASLQQYQPQWMVAPYGLFAIATVGLAISAIGYYRHVVAPVKQVLNSVGTQQN